MAAISSLPEAPWAQADRLSGCGRPDRTLSARSRGAFWLALVVIVAALAMWVAPAAWASYVYVADDGSQRVLHFEARSGERNDVVISRLPDGQIEVIDSFFVSLEPGPGCTSRLDQSYCSGSVDRVVVSLGAEDDRAYVAGGLSSTPVTVDGGAGDDVLYDSAQPMLLMGGDGDDMLLASSEGDTDPDVYVGGDGFDTVSYFASRTGPVAVSLDGVANDGSVGEGDDVEPDVERVYGGRGDDVLIGSDGDDVLWGEDGDDLLDGRGGADWLAGGYGVDVVDYSNRDVGVTVRLDGLGSADGEPGEGDDDDVEGVLGGRGDDTLVGDATSGLLLGNAGDDRISDTGGTDRLDGGPGDDSVDSADATADAVACGEGIDAVVRDETDTSSACEAEVVRTTPEQPPASPPRPEQPPQTPIPPPSQAASADRTPPTATLHLGGRHTVTALLSRGLTISIGCNEPCRTRVRVTARDADPRLRRRARISARTVLAAGGPTTAAVRARALTIRPTRAGRRTLPMLAGASLTLDVTVWDRADNRRRIIRRLRLASERFEGP